MVTHEQALTDQQYEDMCLGVEALWAFVVKNRASLERLVSMNKEINAYLSRDNWDVWIDYAAVIKRFEEPVREATLFLDELDVLLVSNGILPVDLVHYGMQLVREMRSDTVKSLMLKFRQVEREMEAQLEQKYALRILAEIAELEVQQHQAKVTHAGYIENGNGTVTDTRTNLMWMQCAEGQVDLDTLGTVLKFDWHAAMEIPDKLNARGGFAGFADWRLPTSGELQSLVRLEERPTICLEVFPNAPEDVFWSSTPFECVGRDSAGEAWNVYFGNGGAGVNSQDNCYAVRLVRTNL